jgi:glycerophosphoryl diester phosphodiesterase
VENKQRVFCHRGIWGDGALPNSPEALFKALNRGFSLETDIRDALGEVVISHDPVKQGDSVLSLKDLRTIAQNSPGYVALNVKSDGLHSLLQGSGEREFFFDMSTPEAIRYSRLGFNVAKRLSDFEPEPSPQGVEARNLWLDGFDTDWFTRLDLSQLASFDRVVVVSPELHRRDKQPAWDWLSGNWLAAPNLCICTDWPEDFVEHIQK